MASMTGADADALDRAAEEFARAAERLRSGCSRVERQLHSAPWNGRGADAFRQEWNARRRVELAAAADFMERAGTTLRRNAEEQRSASQGSPGATTQMSSDGSGNRQAADSEISPDLERIRHQLELLGIGVGAIDDALELMLALAATPGFDLGPILSTLENLGHIADLSDMVGKVSKGLDVAGYAIEFITALGDHSALPFDEMLVAATVTVGVSVAMSAGAEVAGQLVGKGVAAGLIATGVGAPAAPLADFVVSRVTSFVVGEGLEYADERFDISENTVDTALDVYRYAKTHDLGDMAVDALKYGGDKLLDVAESTYETITFWD